ncbi:epimerase [Ammoniphilus oxalaticus]|uniref:Epimerase n=1 Tax=Ammoniphilus oxalaticus TaxID=66863 RepID=A0A419SGT9_9BACL|nr:NAD-dependent epimerase/dehydratase family protein [Ammoniphilus oxalaticus]RKD23014.1 epimerase [Ammoniphilus oxalaticus]
MKNVFVLGGTGLLGFYTVNELVKRGYTVSAISRDPQQIAELLPQEVKEKHTGDINQLTDEQVLEMLQGKDAFVYAAGLDERTLPQAPAAHFYYTHNVLPTQRLVRLARAAGVKKFVIFGSYHCHFAEKWTDLDLATAQPYARTRLLQEQVAFLEGEGAMDVISLRLPFIFGTMPFRTPLWKMFVNRVKGQDVVPVLNGGTAMVTAQQVAEAAIGAIEYGRHGSTYAISGINMKYKEFYEIIADLLEQKDTVVQVVPLDQMKAAYRQVDEQAAAEGKEYGIHIERQADMQDRDAYIDPMDTMPILKYSDDDVRACLIETIKTCI